MLIFLFVIVLVALFINTLSYLANEGVSFYRSLVIKYGLYKNYKITDSVKVLPFDTIMWEKTEFKDFKIRVKLVDEVNRLSNTYYGIIVDKNGIIREGVGSNNNILNDIERYKDEKE